MIFEKFQEVVVVFFFSELQGRNFRTPDACCVGIDVLYFVIEVDTSNDTLNCFRQNLLFVPSFRAVQHQTFPQGGGEGMVLLGLAHGQRSCAKAGAPGMCAHVRANAQMGVKVHVSCELHNCIGTY